MANFPTDVLPSDIKIGSHYQTTESTTQSYRRRVATRGGHRWSFELSYNPQKQSAFSKIFAFIHSLKGRFGSCTFDLPNYSTQSNFTMKSGITDITVSTTVSNGTEISLAGIDTGSQIKAGDFFSIQGSTKKYMVTQDVTTTSTHSAGNDNAGATPIYFCPALIQQADAGNTITFNQEFQVSLAEDEFYVNFPMEKTFSTSIKLIETTTSTGSTY